MVTQNSLYFGGWMWVSVIILSYFTSGVWSQNTKELSALQLSNHDLFLKVGQNATVSMISTSSFQDVFQNVTNQTVLVFKYSVPENEQFYINPLDNVTLAPLGQNQTGINVSINVVAKHAGSLTVTSLIVPPVENYTGKEVFIRVSIYKLAVLNIISDIVGWIYFAAWSISFYPQIYQNFQRKSVRGLSFEFVFLNITGFTVYAIYNIGLFWVKSIQQEYYEQDPSGTIPVQVNDVVFAAHAVFASSLTGLQCLIYDRGSQTVSNVGRSLLIGISAFIVIMLVVAISNAISWLTFLFACSYVKLFITLVKYVPQAYLNYARKSTSGWCIGNVLLDFTGGLFSIVQMLIISYNQDDWYSFFGDLTKFGLGLFSIIFDIFFIVQHYVLYRSHREYEPIEGSPDPVINPHEDMITSNHIQSSFDEGNQVPRSDSIDSIRRIQSDDD